MKKENQESDAIIDKINFLGLDLDKIPGFLFDFENLNYRPTKMYDERKYCIYKELKIKDIQILLTPTDRMIALSEKYKLAAPLIAYLNSEKEELLENYTQFLKMVRNLDLDKIEKIEAEQKMFEEKKPFQIKYERNYLWQIYYAEDTQKYFMLVPTKESETESFFYLLKKQIEISKSLEDENKTIYVPISHENYTEQFLTRDEIVDLENYLWLFTNGWPSIYEVFDKDEKMTLHITGKTLVYEKIKSEYAIKITTKDEAVELYKLLKALFIMQTSLEEEFKFKTKISKNGGLDFYFNNQKLQYNDLSEFIKNEVKYKIKNIKDLKDKIFELERKLNSLNRKSEEQNFEYLYKQNQVVTFLECKKSFIGKIKYFFTSKKQDKNVFKLKKKVKNDVEDKKQEKIESTDGVITYLNDYDENTLYTIEDLMLICKEHRKYSNKLRNLNMDIKAMDEKIKVLKLKINSIDDFIADIEKHKKSIWEFLKYLNKNNNLSLTEGIHIDDKKEKIEKVFDYLEDIEEFGRQVDDIQRKKLNKEELDGLFVISQNINLANLIKNDSLNDELIEKMLNKLKEEYQENRETIEKRDFDIFGAISEDNTKIKVIANHKHRENEKEKFKLLKINADTSIKELNKNMNYYLEMLKGMTKKIKTPYKLSLYKIGNIKDGNYELMNLSEKEVIRKLNIGDDNFELIKVSVPEDSNVLFLSNSVYYDNYNKTLPLGMDISNGVILNLESYTLTKENEDEFQINFIENQFEVKVKKIKVKEYKLVEKEMIKNDK